jgi:hypothetical protein
MDISLALLKTEGNGGKSRFASRCRNQPILQRNLRKSLRFLVMGSTLSALKTPFGSRSKEDSVARSNNDDDEDIRPSKRQKLIDTMKEDGLGPSSSSRPPLGQVTDERSNLNAKPQPSIKVVSVQPSDLNGQSRSIASKHDILKRQDIPQSRSRISDIVPSQPANFKKALRIEVRGVVHTSAGDEATFELRRRKGPIDVKCRCSVALHSGQNDQEPGARIEPKNFTMNFRKSQICILRTTIDDDGKAKRDLINLQPFVVSADEFLVNRKKRDRRGNLTESFELAEKHWMQVTLEPVGPQIEWPPFDRASLTIPWDMDDGSYEKSNPGISLRPTQ